MNMHADPRASRWIKNADNKRRRRQDPARIEEENEQQHTRQEESGVLQHESIQRATAREQPGVLEYKSIQRAMAREQPSQAVAHLDDILSVPLWLRGCS